MWLNTTMQPPDAGTCSPPRHVRFVVASNIGLSDGHGQVERPATGLLQLAHSHARRLLGARPRHGAPEVTCKDRRDASFARARLVRRAAPGEAARSRQVAARRPAARRPGRGVRDGHRDGVPRYAVGPAGAGRHRRRLVRRHDDDARVRGDARRRLAATSTPVWCWPPMEAERRWPGLVPVAMCADLPCLPRRRPRGRTGPEARLATVRGRRARAKVRPSTPRRWTSSRRASDGGPQRCTRTPAPGRSRASWPGCATTSTTSATSGRRTAGAGTPLRRRGLGPAEDAASDAVMVGRPCGRPTITRWC